MQGKTGQGELAHLPSSSTIIQGLREMSPSQSLDQPSHHTVYPLILPHEQPQPMQAPSRSSRYQDAVSIFWSRNKGLAMVILSQFFGTIMNVITRLLERDSGDAPGMHPFQILFARMVGTLLLSFTYLWWAKVKDAPFGPKEVRALLMARGFGGFFGVCGVYYSLRYLSLSDATVITFLAPTVACFACSILIKEPFTRSEQLAGLVSFLGVILIARPTVLFSGPVTEPVLSNGSGNTTAVNNFAGQPAGTHDQIITSSQRLGAVGWALIGVVGAACAYTTIRWIGQRAHPLISVTYFASWTTFVSFVALCAIPGIDFRLPTGITQWSYLFILGVCGFVMQYLLTQGLAYERSSRATNMVYTQMLFAILFDKIVWNETPDLISACGSSLILGSAVYIAVQNSKPKEPMNHGVEGNDEELGMLDDDNDDGDTISEASSTKSDHFHS